MDTVTANPGRQLPPAGNIFSAAGSAAPADPGKACNQGKADAYVQGAASSTLAIDPKTVADALLSPGGVLSPGVLWVFKADGCIHARPLLGQDGSLCFGTHEGTIYSIDSRTGNLNWSIDAGEVVSSDLVSNNAGIIYVPGNGRDRLLRAVDEKTGGEVWNSGQAGVPSRSVSLDNGALYMGCSIFEPISKIASACTHGKVMALDGSTGRMKWEFITGDMVVSTPMPGPCESVYCGTYDDMFYSLDKATGHKNWEFKADGWISSSPAFSADGKVFFGTWAGSIMALDGKTGKKVWDLKTGGDVRGNLLSGPDGTLYAGSYDGHLYALDGDSGKVRWKGYIGEKVHSSPVMDKNGVVYIAGLKGKILAFESESGKKKWEFSAEGEIEGAPAIDADGRLYIGTKSGKLYALDTEKLDMLIEKLKTGRENESPGEGSQIEVFDDFIVVDGIKLPLNKKSGAS